MPRWRNQARAGGHRCRHHRGNLMSKRVARPGDPPSPRSQGLGGAGAAVTCFPRALGGDDSEQTTLIFCPRSTNVQGRQPARHPRKERSATEELSVIIPFHLNRLMELLKRLNLVPRHTLFFGRTQFVQC